MKYDSRRISNLISTQNVINFGQPAKRYKHAECYKNIATQNVIKYKCIGYNINVMQTSSRLVVNPVTVNKFSSLFNCTPVGHASDSVMDRT